jgi:hypothetical protein
MPKQIGLNAFDMNCARISRPVCGRIHAIAPIAITRLTTGSSWLES